jgi:hypothetical protein
MVVWTGLKGWSRDGGIFQSSVEDWEISRGKDSTECNDPVEDSKTFSGCSVEISLVLSDPVGEFTRLGFNKSPASVAICPWSRRHAHAANFARSFFGGDIPGSSGKVRGLPRLFGTRGVIGFELSEFEDCPSSQMTSYALLLDPKIWVVLELRTLWTESRDWASGKSRSDMSGGQMLVNLVTVSAVLDRWRKCMLKLKLGDLDGPTVGRENGSVAFRSVVTAGVSTMTFPVPSFDSASKKGDVSASGNSIDTVFLDSAKVKRRNPELPEK